MLRVRLQKFCADTEAATADGATFQQKLKCAPRLPEALLLLRMSASRSQRERLPCASTESAAARIRASDTYMSVHRQVWHCRAAAPRLRCRREQHAPPHHLRRGVLHQAVPAPPLRPRAPDLVRPGRSGFSTAPNRRLSAAHHPSREEPRFAAPLNHHNAAASGTPQVPERRLAGAAVGDPPPGPPPALGPSLAAPAARRFSSAPGQASSALAPRPHRSACPPTQVTDPYLNLFRNLIPPLMGQIDFTPIFGFMVLQFLVQVLGARAGPGFSNRPGRWRSPAPAAGARRSTAET